MPAIDSLMKRLGFVKLAHYGLVLTPEGRILSLRPGILDDGFGGRIVGWQDGDLAAAELERWEPARPAPKAAVARRVATPPPPLPRIPQATRPQPIVAVAPAPPAVQTPVMVAAEPVEEDDWEWTIALARARAAAEDSEQAVMRLADTTATAVTPAPRRMRSDTVPPPVAVAKVDPDGFPKTEPLGAIDYTDYTNPMSEIARVVQRAEAKRVTLPAKQTPPMALPVVPPARSFQRPGTTPATVIPIPKLPSLRSTPSSHVAPVVRAGMPTPMLPSSPRRFAKGTGPVLPQSASGDYPISDDTIPGMTLPGMSAAPLPRLKQR